jgi:uroporphyrinogen decarboxylase
MQHQPNFENLRRTIRCEGPPGPVPFFELFADPGMVEAVLGEPFPIDLYRFIGEPMTDLSGDDVPALLKSMEMYVRFCSEVGYDYVFMLSGLNLQRSFEYATDTVESENWPDRQRSWQNEASGPIQSWEDFEAYPWPKPEELRHVALEYVSTIVPEGMKVAAFNYGGVFECSTWMMGLESFAVGLVDQPDLVEAICQRVGELVTATAAQIASIDNVGIVLLSDDLGFSSSTLVSPAVLRRHIVPHYKDAVEAVHQAGRELVYHSCGNMYKLMDDLIDDVGIDAKHSFEDKILPVEEAYRRWGDRIAILGGVDMDLLARGSEEAVRARTREILEVCGTRGTAYALGSGNTAANYLSKQNYLAMLDEGRRWNREHFGTP